MGEKMNKFLNFLGFGGDDIDDTDELYDNDMDMEETEDTEDTETTSTVSNFRDTFFARNKSAKVVNMPNSGSQVKVVILQPNSFEQSQEICEHLKEKKSVIVNLEFVNKDVARRIIDFVSGAVYGLDGNISKVSNAIFLIAPFNYEITNEMAREELKNKIGVSWIKNN